MGESASGKGADEMRDGEVTIAATSFTPQRLIRLSRRSGFTPKQLQLAFDRVRDPWDSRAPIWAEIPASERQLVEQAVLRFTRSQPVFVLVSGEADRLEVFAPGARLGPVVSAQMDVFTIRNGTPVRSWNPRNYWTRLRDLGDDNGAR